MRTWEAVVLSGKVLRPVRADIIVLTILLVVEEPATALGAMVLVGTSLRTSAFSCILLHALPVACCVLRGDGRKRSLKKRHTIQYDSFWR